MDVVDYDARLSELEAQELQAEDDPSEKLYGQLLASYILKDDLISAKFLWKRIPAAIKSEDEDLRTIWDIAVNLIRGTPTPVYYLIREREWPAHVRTIMGRIADRVRDQQVTLISNAYSDIRITDMTKLTGCLNEQETLKLAADLKWPVDTVSQTIRPCKSDRSPRSLEQERDLSQDQMEKLTQYVAFLENH